VLKWIGGCEGIRTTDREQLRCSHSFYGKWNRGRACFSIY